MLKKAFLAVEDQALRLKRRKDVLVQLLNSTMFLHARFLLEELVEDPRIRLWVDFPTPERFELGRRESILKQLKARTLPYGVSRWMRWDLVLFPDHGREFRPQSPSVFMEHGIHMGAAKVPTDDYWFGSKSRNAQGEPKFDRIFCSSSVVRDQVREHFPDLIPRLRVVGNAFADMMLELKERKTQMVKKYGQRTDLPTVVLTSTWGPKSLLQSTGRRLIEPLRRLKKTHNVVFLAHPSNFMEKFDGGGEPWRALAAEMNAIGIPLSSDAWIAPELLAMADVVVSDATSLIASAIMLGRPILLLDPADRPLYPVGLLRIIKPEMYRLDDIDRVEEAIEDAKAVFDPARMDRLIDMLIDHRGESRARQLREVYELLSLDGAPESRTRALVAG